MALKRSLLKGMGLTEEQMDSIIEAHADTVDGLKADLAKYKEASEQLEAVQKELDTLKAKGGDGYEQKWQDEHAAFEAYKTAVEAEKTVAAKKTALGQMLRESGVIRDSFRDLIGKGFDLDRISFDENGAVKDRDALMAAMKTDYADFIGEVGSRSGAGANNPPSGGKGTPMTLEQLKGMSADEINANWAEISTLLSKK